MGRITNKEISQELSYIKGKIDAGDTFAKEHREWEVIEMQKIEQHLREQNGRISNTESSVSWIKGIIGTFTLAIGFLYRKLF